MPSGPTIVISGANRGLGLQFAQQYALEGWRVWAGCRAPGQCAELASLAEQFPGKVDVVQLDVTSAASVRDVADALGDTPVDVLLNNAGTFGPDGIPAGLSYQRFGRIDYDVWSRILQVNLFGPMRLAEALSTPVALSRRKVIANMSSGLGSIANNDLGGIHSYRTSKAGLNALTKGLSVDLADLGVIVVSLAPGWCRTDMGGDDARVDPAESVTGLRHVIEALTPDSSGKFLDAQGREVLW